MSNTVLTIATVYAATAFVSIWLGLIIWTHKDISARSRDTFSQTLLTGIVAVLSLPGLLVYLMVRPRETLTEAYERSLEEEALLQDIEAKAACPGCGQSTDDNWLLCPNCHTTLKHQCSHCHNLLDLTWDICPYCGTSQNIANANENYAVYMKKPQQPNVSSAPKRTDSALQFIDNDDYE